MAELGALLGGRYRLDQVLGQGGAASMDHRGLASFGGGWVVTGGMLAGQAVTDTVTQYLLR